MDSKFINKVINSFLLLLHYFILIIKVMCSLKFVTKNILFKKIWTNNHFCLKPPTESFIFINVLQKLDEPTC